MSRIVLDGRIGWQAAALHDLSAEAELALAAIPAPGPPLADPDGTLGGLTTPIWAVAAALGALFLLDRSGTRILIYDPCLERFRPLACLGGKGSAVGRLEGARALALDARGRLWVADTGNRRLQVVDAVQGRVVAVIGPLAAGAGGRLRPVQPIPGHDPHGLPDGSRGWPPGTWEPMALAALPERGVILADRANDALWRVTAQGQVTRFADATAPLALLRDREGRLHVVQEGLDTILVLGPDGAFIEGISLPERLRDRFGPPALGIDADGTVWISPRTPGPALLLCRDAAGRCGAVIQRQVPPQCTVLAFDRDGKAILGDARRPCLMRAETGRYAEGGNALLGPLDSRLGGCLWDRVALMAAVPMGTRVKLETFTAEAPWSTAEVMGLAADRWRGLELAATDADGGWDAAVLSPPGRYLWLRMTLSGDGTATPALTRVEANWPRVTSRRFLPPALAPDAEAADFMDRFLMIFDQVRAGYTRKLDDLAGFFDPMATPASPPEVFGTDFLDWLGDWIGLSLERAWPVETRRRLVKEAVALYRLRGTPRGLRRHVAIYTGTEPRLIEHFRLRRWMSLGSGRLDAGLQLWGPEVVARLQLDAFAQIGRFVLTDTGDPLTDPLAAGAHRATLLVPAMGFSGEEAARHQAAVERIAAQAAPAHVQLTVRLIEAGFRLGCDAVLGAATQLPCRARPARLDEMLLGQAALSGAMAFRLGPRGGARLGSETRLNG
jgi:phage tail-like protein